MREDTAEQWAFAAKFRQGPAVEKLNITGPFRDPSERKGRSGAIFAA